VRSSGMQPVGQGKERRVIPMEDRQERVLSPVLLEWGVIRNSEY